MPEKREEIKQYFTPPEKYGNSAGSYPDQLRFYDGKPVGSPTEWPKRREEIIKRWESIIGKWPKRSSELPGVKVISKKEEDKYSISALELAAAKDTVVKANLLVPKEEGVYPAVLVVYYNAETSVLEKVPNIKKINKPLIKNVRSYALDLCLRGYVTLAIGLDPYALKGVEVDGKILQPLHWLGFIAENCRRYLASLPEVDASRIGIIGHSFGGKWAMFSSCFNDKFSCAAWSDPGIVFSEQDEQVNYWEPWFLGYEKDKTRKPGIPSETNPRTGAYKELVEQKLDHAVFFDYLEKFG
ncbi:MAG: acyl-CoA thioester hydrolase/BAAT C-terminal domain-containing protein, partial [Candidatus Firestonebacteria bacterium]